MRGSVTRRKFLQVGGATSVAFALSGRGVTALAQGKPDAERIEELIRDMTLEEKITRMGVPTRANFPAGVIYQNYLPPIPRLGIPPLILQDCVCGVATDFTGVTQLPAAITLAAAWDRKLAHEYGKLIGAEAWAKGIEVAQVPGMNLARVPQHGRTFEAFGEDPYLVARLTVADVTGVQSEGPMAMLKHHLANNQETQRDQISVKVSERALREVYMPAFEAGVVEAQVATVMGAKNRIDGTYVCHSYHFLTEVLKDEWGFTGFLKADYNAVHDTVDAIKAGTDMARPPLDTAALVSAVESGEVSEERIDDAIRRQFRRIFEYDLFDDPPRGEPDAIVTSPAHARFARRVSEESTVLLKNEGDLLPLAKRAKVAVIGSAAKQHAFTHGRGAARVVPPYLVTAVEGITRQAGPGASVRYAQGDEPYGALPAIPSEHLSPGTGDGQGLLATYWDQPNFNGAPAFTQVDPTVAFLPALYLDRYEPGDGAVTAPWSARWTGTLTAPSTGTYRVSLDTDSNASLLIDGQTVAGHASRGHYGPRVVEAEVALEAGRPVTIRVDYSQLGEDSHGFVSLGWMPPGKTAASVAEAAETARDADVAVVFAGYFQSETYDLASLRLPGLQDELIRAVAAANPNTVVVLQTGSAVTMAWADDVKAILEAFYPGQEAGNAIASILFGDVNPSGKLPLTFGKSESDYAANTPETFPGVGGVVDYAEGVMVGYRHFDANGIEPLFAFGHGLSYTSFELSDLKVAPKTPGPQGHQNVRCRVRNTGKRTGAEVVQLYLGLPSDVEAPPKQLKGFEKVMLRPGEAKNVTFRLAQRDVSYWDSGRHDWVVPRGDFRLMVGTSSRNIALTSGFHVR